MNGMNTLVNKNLVKGISLRIETDKFFVLLTDGREIGVPYTWFPKLVSATPTQRNNWRFIGKGTGIHWEDVDEDISVIGLLQPAVVQAA
jgi:Protein of unknown function (DUF2442)